MTKEETKAEIAKMKKISPKYLMGTKAYHQLGEISRDEYDLFHANYETDNYWIGSWITGFGFFNVLFPKETSRELTQEEITQYNKTYIQLGSYPPTKLNIP
jgi:hypothetical protein